MDGLRFIKKGATSQSIYFEVLDSTSTSGARKTGLAFNTASLTAYYTRNGAAATAISLVTQTATGAYASGGFVEVSSANVPGLYRLDVPNAAFATGVDSVSVTIKGATGMMQATVPVQLTAIDLQDAVHLGLSAIPNVAAGASGGLPLGDASGRVDVGKIGGTAQTASDLGVLNSTNGIETSYSIAQALRIMLAALGGKVAGLPGSPVYKAPDGTTTRISATTDANGNRSVVTLTP